MGSNKEPLYCCLTSKCDGEQIFPSFWGIKTCLLCLTILWPKTVLLTRVTDAMSFSIAETKLLNIYT